MWCQLRKWGNLGTRGILILVLLGWSALQTETAMSNNVGNPFIRDACNRTKTCGPRTLQDKSEEFWGMVSWPTPEDFFLHFGVRQKHQRHQGGTFWTVGFRPGSELGSARKDLESQDANLGGEAPSFGGVSRCAPVSGVSELWQLWGIQLYCSMGGQLLRVSSSFQMFQPLGMI